MEVIYDKHSEEWSKCLTNSKRKKIAETWLKSGTLDRLRHQRMLEGINPLINNKNTWLTIGDGRFGTDANYILEKGGKAHATDISKKLLEIGHEIGFIDSFGEENAEKLSFNDESFDYVLIKEAFHHCPRPWLALNEAFRVCKKGVILIEPRDVYAKCHGLRKRIYKGLKDLAKLALRKKRYSCDYSFETVGNFIYTTNERELEKFLLGMHYTKIAFKSISDFYINGGENILLDSNIIKDKIKIQLFHGIVKAKEILSFLGFEDKSLLCTILFKEEPEETTISNLKKFNWEYKKLPKNPYI